MSLIIYVFSTPIFAVRGKIKPLSNSYYISPLQAEYSFAGSPFKPLQTLCLSFLTESVYIFP